MIRAWFKNILENMFSKDFKTFEEFETFVDEAKKVDTKLIGFISLQYEIEWR